MKTSNPRRRPLAKLLVPTDFSKGAELALRRALLLPVAEAARIHLLHVLPDNLPTRVRSKVAADAKREMGNLVSRVRRESAAPDIEVTSEILSGQAFVEIIRCSRSLGVDLIVLGRHGRRSVRDMFIGTTADRVLRKGDVPVLIVNLSPVHPYRRPLVATDLEDTSRRAAELAFRVLGPAVNHVDVVHAFRVPFEGFVTSGYSAQERSELRHQYRVAAATGLTMFLAPYLDIGVRLKTSIHQGDPRSVILATAKRRKADLIAIGTHGRSGMAHALLGSVAEWVVTAATCDVLVARPSRFSFEAP